MISIIIVEDIDEIRETTQRYINQSVTDIKCLHTYSNAEDAMVGIVKYRPDVVIMDIGLPKMNGIECLAQIRHVVPKVRFMMFTVFDDSNHVFEALKAGADGYVLKHEPLPRIMNNVRELYSGGAPMSKSIALKVLHSFRTTELIPKSTKSQSEIKKLSPRQLEILEKLAKGYPYKLIANQLNIKEGTVKQHIHQVYKKLHVNNKIEAINKYLRGT